MKKIIVLAAAAFLMLGDFLAMADNEITVQAVLGVSKGYLEITRAASDQFALTATAPAAATGVLLIQTNTAEQISVGDITTAGWAFMKNVSVSNGNNVTLGPVDASTNFLPFLKLLPNEAGVFRLGTNGVWAVSTGTNANAQLEVFILDN